jgi:signal transduction histidine kinase
MIVAVKDREKRLQQEKDLVSEKNQQLLEAQEELVRKEKLSILGQLSGSVGHELRNPLGVMSNAVYYLKMVLSDADENVKEYLGIIKQEIDNSQRIITDLLDFARTKTPHTKTITAHELIHDSLGRCEVPEHIVVRTDLPNDLPALVVDPFQMGLVLQNLMTNAVQSMPGGGSITLCAKRARQDESSSVVPANEQSGRSSYIAISISDTGAGISPDEMKRLFHPLFTTKAKGLGLGLTVCKNLTEANNGKIEVESRPGEGTTFTVTLPAKMDEPEKSG